MEAEWSLLPVNQKNRGHRKALCPGDSLSPDGYHKFIYWHSNCQGDVIGSGEFGRWLAHEGGAFMNAIYTLIKKTPESSLYPLPWEDSEKTTVHEPASRPPSDPNSAGTLTLDFQPRELWEGNFCCLYPPGGSDVRESACNAGDLGSILGQEDPMKEEMATHPSILAWEIPWTEEPGRLQSMGSHCWTRLSD